MKIVLIPLLLVTKITTATFWFELNAESGAGSDGHTLALSGPNEEYLVQGRGNTQRVYQVDWVNGGTMNPSPRTTISIPPHDNIDFISRIASHQTFNVIAVHQSVYRYYAEPGGTPNVEEYPVEKKGKSYSLPVTARNTVYMFVAPRELNNKIKAYRLHSDRVTDMKSFKLDRNTRSYGVLDGTPWIVFSLDEVEFRRLYDFTKGYDGGPGGPVGFHFKQNEDEIGFVSPSDGREFYAVCSKKKYKLYTVKNDGTAHLTVDISGAGTGDVAMMSWIKDSDLVLIPVWGKRYCIANFMDGTQTPVCNKLENGGADSVSVVVWSAYKAFGINSSRKKRSLVYKTLDETPCGDLCGTCDGIFRFKCIDCVQGASKVPGSDSCSCDAGFYEKTLSPTKKDCGPCFEFCATCSGGAATDCIACKYSYMEKKGDGSCGCPNGKYLEGTSCPDCDSSCLTCSGPGPSACTSCDTSKGKYLFVDRCLSCHPSYKTCSGPNENYCLSCDESQGRYLSGSNCLTCPAGTYVSGSTCFPCHSTCATCFAAGPSACLSCSTLGYFVDSGTCRSCSEKEESSCPDPFNIFPPSNLPELRQNIIISFNPSLNDSRIPAFDIKVQEILEKHLKFKFKRRGKTDQTLTILEKNLTHGSRGSELFLKFLEKMRIANTEYILLTVEEPWLFRPTSPTEPQILQYFIKKGYRVPITSKNGQSQRERTMEQTFSAFRITRIAIGIIASLSIIIAACSGLLGPLVHLIRFLNIVEVISNLEKINIRFGARIEGVIEFIEKIKIPEFGILSRLSPIQDQTFEGADVNAYLLNPRGSRGKITTSNGELFIAAARVSSSLS